METSVQNSKNQLRIYYVALVLLLVAAFAIRLAAASVWQNQADREGTLFRFGDSESYWVLGESIAHGTDYQYHSPNLKIFRVPTYPLLLSLVAWMEPARTAVLSARVIGCILGTCCVGLVYWATLLILDNCNTGVVNRSTIGFARWAALASAVFAAFYLGAIGMSIFILSEAVFCPLMLASLAFLWIANRQISQAARGSALSYTLLVVSGMLSGAAILARPSWILWPGLVFMWLVIYSSNTLSHSNRLARAFVCTCFLCAGTTIVMTPWWIRNYQVSGHFVPTTLQVGASLYDSCHAEANGSSDTGMTFLGDFAKELAKDRAAREPGQQVPEDLLPFELALDVRLRNAAIDWMLKNPSDAVSLSLVKFWRTWTPLPQAAQLGGGMLRIAEAIGYLAILATAVVAIFRKLSLKDPAILFALPCVYFAVIHSVFVGSVRYRQPAILAMCVLAGIGTAWIVVKCIQRTPQQTTPT